MVNSDVEISTSNMRAFLSHFTSHQVEANFFCKGYYPTALGIIMNSLNCPFSKFKRILKHVITTNYK